MDSSLPVLCLPERRSLSPWRSQFLTYSKGSGERARSAQFKRIKKSQFW